MKTIIITESQFKRMLSESINEKFASNRLSQLAREHGGIEKWINGGRREGAKAWYDDKAVDLASVTDDQLYGEPFVYDEVRKNAYPKMSQEQSDMLRNAVLFNDGYAIALKPRRLHVQDGTNEPNPKAVNREKYGSGIGDTGDHNRKPSPFDSEGYGKKQRQEYNPYAVSDDAGYAASLRNAFKNNKEDAEYYAKNGIKDREAQARRNMIDNKKNARELVRNHKRNIAESTDSFEEMEQWVFGNSVTYRDSYAFRYALEYIKKRDLNIYRKLIEREYQEGAGY